MVSDIDFCFLNKNQIHPHYPLLESLMFMVFLVLNCHRAGYHHHFIRNPSLKNLYNYASICLSFKQII